MKHTHRQQQQQQQLQTGQAKQKYLNLSSNHSSRPKAASKSNTIWYNHEDAMRSCSVDVNPFSKQIFTFFFNRTLNYHKYLLNESIKIKYYPI